MSASRGQGEEGEPPRHRDAEDSPRRPSRALPPGESSASRCLGGFLCSSLPARRRPGTTSLLPLRRRGRDELVRAVVGDAVAVAEGELVELFAGGGGVLAR